MTPLSDVSLYSLEQPHFGSGILLDEEEPLTSDSREGVGVNRKVCRPRRDGWDSAVDVNAMLLGVCGSNV